MPNLVPELNSLDFSVYVGGPLQAAIKAQTEASMATVSFIKEVGFENDGNDSTTDALRYVDFEYNKSVPNPNYLSTDADLPAGTNTTDEFLESRVAIKVPFLTMLTIPSLRVDEVNIDFNARLSSTETSNIATEFGAKAELGLKFRRIRFKASASYKRNTSQGVKVDKTYNLGVQVKAVNDELPAGLARVLDLLEDGIATVTA